MKLVESYLGTEMASPNDFFNKSFWDGVKDVGFITAVGILIKTLWVDRRKVVDDSALAKRQLEFDRERAISVEVATQVKDNLAFFQSENTRLQADFESRIREVKEDARHERERIIEKFEQKQLEDDLAYNEIVRQMNQLKEVHLGEMHLMELRHKDEITALQITHNNEKNALRSVISELEAKIEKLEQMPRYGGQDRRQSEGEHI